MDHSAIRAMARWPNVPAVYGWLSLDRRGRWCLRGEPVVHRGVIQCIDRNYDCTDDGQWFFQNGPQRVFVDLDYTPWIYILDGAWNLIDHTGNPMGKLHEAWLDEEGNLLLLSERGIGLLCDRDLGPISDSFRSADGAHCDEDSVARLVDGTGAPGSAPIFLEWRGETVEVKKLLRRGVAGKFEFEARPRAGDGDA